MPNLITFVLYCPMSPKILYKGGFSSDNTYITYENKPHKMRRKYESLVKVKWQEFIHKAEEQNLQIWDGTTYRASSINIKNSIKLKLSTIKFSRIKAFSSICKEYSDINEEEYTNHLSTIGVIKTADNYFVMGVRGKNINSSDVDFIGGGIQEDNVKINTVNDIELNQIIEMQEELNVTKDIISNIKGCGIVHSSSTNVIFVYYVTLLVNKVNLQNLFKKRKDFEMINLLFLKYNEYKNYLNSLSSYRPLVCELV